jgi:large subunit ribosomal protein L32
MAVPKHKVSKSRRDMRRASNFNATTCANSDCPQCHEAKRPHCVCKSCGFYNGKQRILGSKELKEKKKKA